MKEDKKSNNRNQGGAGANRDSSIGNQQKTTQTGAQNTGGENIDQEDDEYTEDLRQSGDRESSNTKKER